MRAAKGVFTWVKGNVVDYLINFVMLLALCVRPCFNSVCVVSEGYIFTGEIMYMYALFNRLVSEHLSMLQNSLSHYFTNPAF